jgi:hypothetical protein
MAYIGKTPVIGNFQVCDAITVVDAQAAYTMQVGGVNVSPESANHMLVSLNAILQAPTSSFTVSGSTITFASALETGDVIDFIQILGNVLDLGVPSDNTVTTAKLADSSVSLAKLTATGTKDATTFLRGDNTFASAGLSGWSEDGANNNLLPASASAGIYLGVTSATAANLLDDYEEGIFTPTFTSTSASFSYSFQNGYYTKIGRSVTCHIFIRGQSSGTTSNSLFISGLPFTSLNSSSLYASGSFGQIESVNYSGGVDIVGHVSPNQSQISLQYTRDDTTTLGLPASAVDKGTSSGFMFSINYFTD